MSFRRLRTRFTSDRNKLASSDLLNVDGETLDSMLQDDIKLNYEVIDHDSVDATLPEDSIDVTPTSVSIDTTPVTLPIDVTDCDSTSRCAEMVLDSGFKDESEKMIYELQLTQLQEQLMTQAVENQSLRSKLADLKENVVDNLQKELAEERMKNDELETELRTHGRSSPRRKSLPTDVTRASVSDVFIPQDLVVLVDVATEVVEDSGPSKKPLTRSKRLTNYLLSIFHEFLEDISETSDDIEVEESEGEPLTVKRNISETSDDIEVAETEGEPLTVKRLKESIKRFGTAIKPYINAGKGLYNLVTWKSPVYTLVVFMTYMYCLWRGSLLSLILFLLIFKLTLNLLHVKGCTLNINFLDGGKEEKDNDEDLGVSDKLQLVLSVARKVQNMLTTLADGLEKIRSLLFWRHSSTRKLFGVLVLGLCLSLIFPPSSLFHLLGYYLGIKFFLIDFIFSRFPRLKMKHDTTHLIWLELPTDAEYEKTHEHQSKFLMLPEGRLSETLEPDKSFSDLFSLSNSEVPLSGWVCGKRCTLINKNKPITGGGIKNGLLFLTKSYLCFLRSKTPNSKNIAIPLTEIAYVEKAKPYAWMPGKGFALEVGLIQEKVYLFAALINRDEVLEQVLAAGKHLKLPWAYTE